MTIAYNCKVTSCFRTAVSDYAMKRGRQRDPLPRGLLEKRCLHVMTMRDGCAVADYAMESLWTCYGHAKARTWPHYATFWATPLTVEFTQNKQRKMLIVSNLCYKLWGGEGGIRTPGALRLG